VEEVNGGERGACVGRSVGSIQLSLLIVFRLSLRSLSLSLSLLRRNGGREGGRSRLLTDSGEEETKIDAVLYTATVTQRREGDEPPLLIWVENVRGGNNTIY
jgi:hypothetical protein